MWSHLVLIPMMVYRAPVSINIVPATARAGVIVGWMGNPSIFGTVVPLTLSEPLAIGVAVTSAEELDAAALVALAGVPEVLLIPSNEESEVASAGNGDLEWVVEVAAACSGEVVASRGSTACGCAVLVGQFDSSDTTETAR